MKHFYNEIHGWFDFDNIYSKMVEMAKEGAKFVEVGSWKGKSAAFMCVEIANSGKDIKFDCVDAWNGMGQPGEYDRDHSVIKKTLYEEFVDNMKPVEGLYNPIRSLSYDAANLYEDQSVDFVFIDAGHSYSEVKKDILSWLPKVKIGGYIGGHDYVRVGVQRAVNEAFEKFELDRSSWISKISSCDAERINSFKSIQNIHSHAPYQEDLKMNKLCMFCMVKNEADFIETFLNHNLPIFDRAVIIDNGSNDGTLEILERYASPKLEVIQDQSPLGMKGQMCSKLMLDSSEEILFPLDADELLVYDEGDSGLISKDQKKIRSYLQSIPTQENECRFKVRRNLQKHPDSEEWFGISNISKMFFSKKGFLATDMGNHDGDCINKKCPFESKISFLDYRMHSKEYWERRQIEKLKNHIGDKWNDPNTLVSYRGAGMHCAIEYASYLGLRKCAGCKEVLPSENFGIGRVMCVKCRPSFKNEPREGKGVWCRVRKDLKLKFI